MGPFDSGDEMVAATELRHALAEIELMRRRRELLFWSIRMTLALVMLATITVAVLVSLVRRVSMDPALMAVGVAITGASAAGGPIGGRLRRYGGPQPRASDIP
jgi:hypothetical protein